MSPTPLPPAYIVIELPDDPLEATALLNHTSDVLGFPDLESAYHTAHPKSPSLDSPIHVIMSRGHKK